MTGKIRALDYPNVTRTTYRDYTHVIIVFNEDGSVRDKSFCGSESLVQKRERQLERIYEQDYINAKLKIVVSEVEEY